MFALIQKMMTLNLISVCVVWSSYSAAETLSFHQVEKIFLDQSFGAKASSVLSQSDQLNKDAVNNLGLPTINLNAGAYAFQQRVQVPIDSLKDDLKSGVQQNLDQQLDAWGNQIPGFGNISGDINLGVNSVIDAGFNLLPNRTDFNLRDENTFSNVAMFMPIYTGGLITATKNLAALQSEKGSIRHQQEENVQRFEIIQAYFNVQLQKQLLASGRYNLKAMQKHYDNAQKLEQQGFISKGQRMMFEVARNNAERVYQSTEANYRASLFKINNLLQQSQVTELSTPLFVNLTQNQNIEQLLTSFQEKSPLIQQLQKDTQLASENVKLLEAAKKPTVFAFGEYALNDKNEWVIGVAATYNLFSGIDKNKKIQAAELTKYASQLATERTKQQLEILIYQAYSELRNAQNTHKLLEQNLQAALENLRIQDLSFQEDMGTATSVIDAQNAVTTVKSEMALNSYKYIMSLAVILQTNGSINQFQSYVNQANTSYIK